MIDEITDFGGLNAITGEPPRVSIELFKLFPLIYTRLSLQRKKLKKKLLSKKHKMKRECVPLSLSFDNVNCVMFSI